MINVTHVTGILYIKFCFSTVIYKDYVKFVSYIEKINQSAIIKSNAQMHLYY